MFYTSRTEKYLEKYNMDKLNCLLNIHIFKGAFNNFP